ncbi:MAG: C25 family cysteine peptidase [Candidatus Thermoplasmatota archaeon]
MKKFIVFLIVAMFIITGFVSADVQKENNLRYIVEEIMIKEPIISEVNEFVELDIFESNIKILNSGKPSLPKIVKTYTFPFGTKINDVVVTFSDRYQKDLSKPLKPTPELQMISTIYVDSNNIDENFDYSDINIYPEEQYTYKKGAGLFNGEHVIFLSIHIYPVQYLPKLNKIEYSKDITVNVEFFEPYENICFPDFYDYLILAPLEFKDELQPLVDYKNNDEVDTILVTLDEIPDIGVDKQESIKYFIKDAVENMGITYLLLVGAGVEEEEIFPVRNAWVPSGNYEQYFPSDLYYADIYDAEGNFSDWNSDDDGKFAEFKMGMNSNDMDSVDMYPDVYLGKLPCNSEEEVVLIVEKIINYEEHNEMLNNIVQIGGDTFPGDASEVNEGEFANEKVLEKLPGYNSIKLWASESNGASTLTKQNIANGFNNNADFIDFSGHGSSASWATHAPADDGTWLPPKSIRSPYTGWLYIDYDFFLVSNNYKHPVVVFNACSCNKYSESDNCIGWKTINSNAGGIAAFGASGIGYGSYGVHEVERVWGWMEVHIFESLYNDKILGDVWANCLNDYINSFIEDEWDDSDYKTILEMSMFGDPTISIEDGKDPRSLNIEDNQKFSILLRFIENFTIINRLLKLI